jgi:hypothetical protein
MAQWARANPDWPAAGLVLLTPAACGQRASGPPDDRGPRLTRRAAPASETDKRNIRPRLRSAFEEVFGPARLSPRESTPRLRTWD